MLLVLDNFEQLGQPAAQLVRTWCQVADQLHVLVTSRVRLAVEGETVIELSPLECPAEEDAPETALATEAVRLLRERVAAVGGDLGEDVETMTTLVRRLDGIPLAIELAAARTRLLSPRALAERLANSFGILEVNRTTASARHATLESAIDWSWNLLSPEEQQALGDISVFAGGFTIHDAERVLGADAASAVTIMDLVAALRDKSLVQAAGAEGRLGLLVSVREYAARKLEDRDPHAVERLRIAHARHYAARVRTFNEGCALTANEPDAALRIEMTPELENLLVALEFLRGQRPLRSDDVEAFCELALAVAVLHPSPDLAGAALDDALATLDHEEAGQPALRVRILLARHAVLNWLGRFEDSRADLETVLATEGLRRELRPLALQLQGVQLRYQSACRLAWESHVRAEQELRRLDLPRVSTLNWACMGRLQGDFGDEVLARKYNEQARVLAVDMGDRRAVGWALANLAQVEQEHQRFEVAASMLEESIACFRDAGEPRYQAIYTAALGDLNFEWGRHDEARRRYGEAERFLGAAVAHRSTVLLYAAWSALEASLGHGRRAADHLEKARRGARRNPSASVRLIVALHAATLALPDPGHAAQWRTRLAALSDPHDPEHEVLATSLEVRFAARMLRRALGVSRESAPPRTLTIGPGAAWFALAGGPAVDLRRRAAPRRILAALVAQHATHNHIAVSHDALVASGWPGENLRIEAAGTRLRVAIATLRGYGLRDVLLTTEDGYLIGPDVRVVTDRAAEPM
jgi:predicted ATPase